MVQEKTHKTTADVDLGDVEPVVTSEFIDQGRLYVVSVSAAHTSNSDLILIPAQRTGQNQEADEAIPGAAPATVTPAQRVLVGAAVNMARSIEALGPALEAVETPVSPQLARSAQATENLWRSMEHEFGLLTATEVSELVGSKSPNRSYAHDQRKAGKLLAVKRAGAYRYPGFQIDRDEHAVRPVMANLLRVAADAGRTESGLALWMVIPTGYLDGARPVDKLSNPESVVEAARHAFNVQW